MPIFTKDEDFIAFETVLEEAVARTGSRLLSYCLMGNHWHLVVWPQEDEELSRFVGWLTLTHTQRWHAHRKSTGSGHLYQGRFKSFPVQDDDHLLTVCRNVERNALRANLVERAEDWRWSSLHRWHRGSAEEKALLSAWPLRRSAGWLEHVNSPQTDAELASLRRSVNRGSPFGDETWATTATKKLGLEITNRHQGRPPIQKTVPDTFVSLMRCFKGTLQTLNQFLPLLAAAVSLDHWYNSLLTAIATHLVADRPDRIEPRCRKRRPKKFKNLREHRSAYQNRLRSRG